METIKNELSEIKEAINHFFVESHHSTSTISDDFLALLKSYATDPCNIKESHFSMEMEAMSLTLRDLLGMIQKLEKFSDKCQLMKAS
jgi:hypothetical protein